MSSRGVVDKSLTNIFWSYLAFFSTKALNLIAIVIIAMFLTPAEFGLMAFGLLILGYFEMLQGFGMAAFLMSTREDVDEAAHAVFAFAVAASAAIFGALWMTADLTAAFFDQPALAEVLRFLCFALLIEAVAQVHNSLLQRELRFRLKMMPEIGRGLVKGLLSIALAASGFGIWALVYGHLAGAAAWTLILIAVRPWRPRRLPKRDVLIKAIAYGSNIVVGALCNVVPRTLDQFLIGKFLGAGPLGLYALALRMPQLALKTLGMEANKVIHPVISQMQLDSEAVRTYYFGLIRYMALIVFPAGVALAAVTPSLIRIIYSDDWLGMIVPMQYLSIAFALGVINQLPGTLYKALYRSDLFLYMSLINLPFSVILFWIAVPYGIEMVALAQIALVFLLYLPNFFMLRRVIGIAALPTLKAAVPGVLCAAVTAAGATLAQLAAPADDLYQLAATSLGALVAFLLALRGFGPEVFTELRRIIVKKLGKRRRSAGK